MHRKQGFKKDKSESDNKSHPWFDLCRTTLWYFLPLCTIAVVANTIAPCWELPVMEVASDFPKPPPWLKTKRFKMSWNPCNLSTSIHAWSVNIFRCGVNQTRPRLKTPPTAVEASGAAAECQCALTNEAFRWPFGLHGAPLQHSSMPEMTTGNR